MAMISSLVHPDEYVKLTRNEQEQLSKWINAEFLLQLPQDLQNELISSTSIRERLAQEIADVVLPRRAAANRPASVPQAPGTGKG